MTIDTDSTPAKGIDLRSKMLFGMSWAFVQQFATQVISFSTGIALARLLTPDEFGTLAMVSVLTGFAMVFNNMGTASLVVTKSELSQHDLSTIFWFNITIGFVIAATICGSAGWIAAFYETPSLYSITLVMSSSFILTSTGATSAALLQRRLQFDRLAAVATGAVLLSSITAIAMAWYGFGVWALVARILIAAVTVTVASFYLARWFPSFQFSKHSLSQLWSYGSPLTGNRIMNYWLRNADNMAVGKYWGATSLGAYDLAYRLMRLPLSQASAIIAKVMLPALSLIKEDKQRVKRLYIKTATITAVFAFPFSCFVFLYSDAIIDVLYGQKWAMAVPLLRVLALLGGLHSVSMINGAVFESQNQTKFLLWSTLPIKLIILAVILISVRYSVLTLAISYVIVSLVVMVPYCYIVGRVIPMGVAEFYGALAKPFIAAVLMTCIAFATSTLLPEATSSLTHLCVGAVVCGVSYVLLITLLQVPIAREVYDLLVKKILKRKKAV